MAKILYVSSKSTDFPVILRKLGHEVLVARSGEDALGVCYCSPPIQVVIAELDLPDIQASAMMETIRIVWAPLPVIYLAKDLNTALRKIGFDINSFALQENTSSGILVDLVNKICAKQTK